MLAKRARRPIKKREAMVARLWWVGKGRLLLVVSWDFVRELGPRTEHRSQNSAVNRRARYKYSAERRSTSSETLLPNRYLPLHDERPVIMPVP
jgi:hypothetical protein